MNTKNLFAKIVLVFTVLFYSSSVGAAVRTYKLDKRYVRTVGAATCGYVKTWKPGKYAKGKFTAYADTLADLKKQAKALSGKAKAKLNKKIAALKKKIADQKAALCDTLSAPANIASLKSLPKVNRLVATNGASSAVITGTPPQITEISDIGAKSLFWRAGVVEALAAATPAPSSEQCREFWAGFSDGVSGGFQACVMAQFVGQAFEPVAMAGTSACYMQNAPTKENMAAGAIEVLSGSLPNKDIRNLFNPPLGTQDRLVKVVSGQTIFIRVFSAAHNAAVNSQYRATLWFCNGGSPRQYQLLDVKNDGLYTAEMGMTEEGGAGAYQVSVSAYLTGANQNAVTFDTSRPRTVLASYQEDGGAMRFKTKIEILDGGQMLNRRFDYQLGGANQGKRYFVSNFTGTNFADLRFLEAGFKGEDRNGSQPVFESEGAAEYRDDHYAASPANSLAAAASVMDFAADDFYTDVPEVSLDWSDYSCSATPDIAVGMDMGNPTLAAALAPCEQMRLQEMLFCSTAEISQAQDGWNQVCPAIMAGE